MTITIDSREPWPHPRAPCFGPDVRLVRATLETGDLALSALPEGCVIERKTVPDFLGCIGGGRERFERELRRSRYVGRFIIIVEGTLADMLEQNRAIHPNAIIGTVAAWQRRYCPICFAGSVQLAAQIAESFVRGQIKETNRTAGAISRKSKEESKCLEIV
jgi:ERCC4-type nuclease